MSQPRNRPSVKEWADRKPQIEQLYLEENRTLEEVSTILAEDNFHATIRQYKTRLKAWGYDSKKIRGEVWKAMSMAGAQLKRHQWRVVFIVPFRGGQQKDITQDLISKQMRRTTAQLQDMYAAAEVLEQNGVQIVCTDVTTGKQTHLAPRDLCSQNPAKYEPTSLTASSTNPRSPATTSRSPSQSGPSTRSPLALSYHNSTDRSYPPPSIPAWPSSSSSTPLGTSVASPRRSYRRLLSPDGDCSTVTESQESQDFDIMSALGELCGDGACNPIMRDALQKYVGSIFQMRFPSSELTEEKRLATQWMAYYLLTLDSQEGAVRARHEEGRKEAMGVFQQLLTDHSRFVFPFCNSVIMILGAEGPNGHLREFLDDCCEVIDKHMQGQELNYGSPFHLARALWLENTEEIQHYEITFGRSTVNIGTIYGVDSPNYIVNQHYYAWLQLHKQNYAEAVRLLEILIPEARKFLGRSHPVTINCYATLARAYTESRDFNAAFMYLHKAIATLDHTSKLLQKYKDRLERRLALLYKATENYAEAEQRLKDVLSFRIEYFGIDGPATWNVVEDLKELYHAQGRDADKRRFVHDMEDRYYRHLYEVEMAKSGGTMPDWVCEFCHNPTCRSNCASFAASSSSRAVSR